MTDETLNLKLALKKQSVELDKRGQIMMKLDEELKEYRKFILTISAENKKLEAMIESAKAERQKFLEDNVSLEDEIKKVKEQLLSAHA